MTRSIALLVVGLVIGSVAGVSSANMPPPQLRDKQLQITLRDGGGPARMCLPRDMVAPAPESPARTAQLPTMIAGVALACAVTLAGMKLVSRRRGLGMAAVLVSAGGLALAGAVAVADIAIPRPATQPVPASATVPLTVEVLGGGQTVSLNLTTEQATQIVALLKDQEKAK